MYDTATPRYCKKINALFIKNTYLYFLLNYFVKENVIYLRLLCNYDP